jgi:C_GCAxxG_C_C family probable redox protein
VVIAVGEHYMNPLPDVLLRASDTFGGGVGGSRLELCGALSGGVLLLGALWGRVSAQEDDKRVYALAKQFREQFLEEFGETICEPLRDTQPEGEKRCGDVVQRAVRLLVALIEEERRQVPFRGV